MGLDIVDLCNQVRAYLAEIERLIAGNKPDFDWSRQPSLTVKGGSG
jgi:hypothetical protein